MGRYRKIDPRFWKDEKVIDLSTEEKAVALYGLTAQSNRIGCFVFSPALAAEDLGMLPQTFAERFQNVIRTMKWEYDERLRVIYIPTWWKYNQPETPNNLIGNLKDLDDLPGSPLVSKFMKNLEFLSPQFHETFAQTLRERYPKRYPERMARQEQEQKQKQEEDNGASLSPSSPLSLAACQWLDLLNRETGRQFKAVQANLRPIHARLHEQYTLAQAEMVIKYKVAQWGNDPKMRPYLRPSTIFGPKFDSYLAEASDNGGPQPERMGSQRPTSREQWDKIPAGEVKL